MNDLLPEHGTLTPEQLEGFRVACACMMTWGRQVADSAATLGGQVEHLPPVARMQDRGRFVYDCARALYITIGHGQMPAAPPSLLPSRG